MAIHILHEAKRLRLLAAALELQHYTSTAANVVPVPGTGHVIAIGTPTEVRVLLSTMADSVSTNPGAGLTSQQVVKLLFAADILEGVDCEDTAGDLRDIARGAV